MKHRNLLLVFLVSFCSSLFAQELRFGVKGGANVATIGGDHTENLDPRISMHLGGLIEVPLSGKFALQPELLYSSQGSSQQYYNHFTDSKVTTKTKLDYINVPVMGKFNINTNLSIELGPQLGFLVSARNKYKDHMDSGRTDVKDFYSTLDFGVGAGGSYYLYNGVFFSIRFNKGISNIKDAGFDYYYTDPGDGICGTGAHSRFRQRNNVLQVSAGYTF